MTLYVHFQDVTYETLTQEGFGEKLRDAFPQVDWDKPFNEVGAAEEDREEDEEEPGGHKCKVLFWPIAFYHLRAKGELHQRHGRHETS